LTSGELLNYMRIPTDSATSFRLIPPPHSEAFRHP
jgi:hypothetical protein